MTNILIPAKGFLSPYKYSYFYEAWNDMRQINIWRLDRITFDKDKSDFRKLDPETQYLVKYLLSSFGINELAIGESWATRAFNHIKNEEILLALTEILAQECFKEDTQILTETGFLNINKVPANTKIAQYDMETGKISFALPLHRIEKQYEGYMERYLGGVGYKKIQVDCTENHELLEIHPLRRKLTKTKCNSKIRSKNYLYPHSQQFNQIEKSTFSDISPLIRVLIALQADGTIKSLCPSNSKYNGRTVQIDINFNNRKSKLSRIKRLLKLANLRCEPVIREDKAIFQFMLPESVDLNSIKDMGFIKTAELSQKQAREILREISHWDSNKRGNLISFYNTNEKAIDKIQEVCVIAGASCVKRINSLRGRVCKKGNVIDCDLVSKKDCFVLHITLDKDLSTYGKKERYFYKGDVFCYTMPKGTLITRSVDGEVMVTGNCLHAVAYHRLAEEIGIVEELKEIYEGSSILTKRTEFLRGDPDDFEKTLTISTLFGEMGSLFVSFFLLGDLTRRTGMLSGLNDVNLYSLKDEVINDYSHYKTGLELLKILGFNKKKLKTKYMEEFLTLEDEFIDSLPVKDDLKAELKIYLRWRVIDEAKNLSKCPATMLPFEMVIRGSEMRNMFERKGTNYSTDTAKNDLGDWLC